tara:strand:- start:97 stop:903 length:807 start_codon:yes stop_codon:yes gene_type:complete
MKWDCTIPDTLPEGYVAVSGQNISINNPSEVIGIECDESQGYYPLSIGGINAVCGENEASGAPNFELSGCEHGNFCTRPFRASSAYIGLPDTLPVVSSLTTIPNSRCSETHQGEPKYTCNAAGNEYIPSGCERKEQCIADLTEDNNVNVEDLLFLLNQLQCANIELVECKKADLTGDDKVNVEDLVTILSSFGRTCAPDCRGIRDLSGFTELTTHDLGDDCSADSCTATITCKDATEEGGSQWSCTNGEWTHNGHSGELDTINRCIGN